MYQETNVEKRDTKFVDKNAEWGQMKDASLECPKFGLWSYGTGGTCSGFVNI